jgi:hypothetical protein
MGKMIQTAPPVPIFPVFVRHAIRMIHRGEALFAETTEETLSGKKE